ncbi:MAG TPA: hypothetical protein PLW93_05175 [Candidatus Absconditabacterales bacterium]|nr:hypothetical protein [Candidatus Absconditabacterales bacterium]
MYEERLRKGKEKGEKSELHHIYPVSYGGEHHTSNIAEALESDHRLIHNNGDDDKRTYSNYRRNQSILENGNAIPTDRAIEHMSNAQLRLLKRVFNLPGYLIDLYRQKTAEVMLHEVEKFNNLTGESYIPEIGDILENHEVYTRAKKSIAQYIRETFTQ